MALTHTVFLLLLFPPISIHWIEFKSFLSRLRVFPPNYLYTKKGATVIMAHQSNFANGYLVPKRVHLVVCVDWNMTVILL